MKCGECQYWKRADFPGCTTGVCCNPDADYECADFTDADHVCGDEEEADGN